MHDWLRQEFGLDKPGRALVKPHQLDADGFVAAVRAALPRGRARSAAEIARLKQEYTDTLIPARDAASEFFPSNANSPTSSTPPTASRPKMSR
jgi:hypothetical protein